MSKKIQRLLSLCIVVLFAVSLVACGAGTEKTEGTTAQTKTETAAATSSAEATVVAEQPKEPITIKAVIVMEPVEASTIKTDPVTMYIKEKFGITLDVIDTDSASSWMNKAPAVVAANDLPDLFVLVDQGANGKVGFLDTLLKADAVLPLDDLINQYAPNLTSNVYMKAALEFQKTFFSPDGKLYAFPTCVGVFDNPKAPAVNNYIRWDAYKAAGYPKISNMDELLDALKKMQDIAPKDKNGKKAYGISGWFAESGAGWGDWEIKYGKGMNVQGNNSIYQQYVGRQNMEQANGLTDPNSSYWQTLNFFYKANQMGILDPDAFTTKWDDWNKKVEDGQVLWLNAGWIPGQKNATIGKNISPDAGFVPLPSLDPENFAAKVWNVQGERLYSISKNSKYADRITEMMNWVCSEEGSLVLNNGPEGMAWKMVDGKPVGNPDYLLKSQFDLDMQKEYAANLYHHFKGFSDGTILPTYGTTANLRLSNDAITAQLTSFEKDALNFFGSDTFTGEKYLGSVKNNTFAYPLRDSLGNLPEELMQYNNNIQNYFFKNGFKAILAKSDADYEKIKADMISFAIKNKADDILKWALAKEAEKKPKLDLICKPLIEALTK